MPPNHSANHILGEILAKLSEEDQMKKDVERLQQNSVYATDGAQMIGGDKSAETNISANKPELAVFLLWFGVLFIRTMAAAVVAAVAARFEKVRGQHHQTIFKIVINILD